MRFQPCLCASVWLAIFVLPLHVVAVEPLPSNIVNVALPEFASKIGGGNDYGLANLRPIEVIEKGGRQQEVRVFRSLHQVALSRQREARFRVRIGNIRRVYFWMEAPRIHGQWHLTMTSVYPDRFRKVIFSRNMRNQVIQFAYVDPGTELEVKMSTIEQTSPLSKHYFFTVSPLWFRTWPDYLPTPDRSMWD